MNVQGGEPLCVERLAVIFVRISHNMAKPYMHIIIDDSDNETTASEQSHQSLAPSIWAVEQPDTWQTSRFLELLPAQLAGQKPTHS